MTKFENIIAPDAVNSIDTLNTMGRADSAQLTKAMMPDLYVQVEGYCAFARTLRIVYEQTGDAIGLSVLDGLLTDEKSIFDWINNNKNGSDALYHLTTAYYALTLAFEMGALFDTDSTPDEVARELAWHKARNSPVDHFIIPILRGEPTGNHDD